MSSLLRQAVGTRAANADLEQHLCEGGDDDDDGDEQAHVFQSLATKGRSPTEMLDTITPIQKRRLSVSGSSALMHFNLVERLLEKRRLILLLDYDGTLTPIVNDPSKAVLSDDMRSIIQQLARHFTTGVVSGRSLAKIRNFVGVDGIFYAGSHGFDILTPPIERRSSKVVSAELEDGSLRFEVASEFLPMLQKVRERAERELKAVPNSEVEDNKFSISIHYRNCLRSDLPAVEKIAQDILTEHDGLRLKRGKEVLELQPDFDWNKGRAVVWLLDMLGLTKARKKRPRAQGEEGEEGEGGAQGEEGEEGQGKEGEEGEGEGDRGEGEGDGEWEAGGGEGRGSYDAALAPLVEVEVLDPFGESVRIDEGGRWEQGGRGGQGGGAENDMSVFTIFIGDDKTDEDAFQVFGPEGDDQPGIGILVSDSARDTHATFTLQDPSEVAQFLSKLVEVGKEKGLRPSDVKMTDDEEMREQEVLSNSKKIGTFHLRMSVSCTKLDVGGEDGDGDGEGDSDGDGGAPDGREARQYSSA